MESRKGILIDYEFCTGCHSCEIACKEEHRFPLGVYGIKILEDGPRVIDKQTERYEWRYIAAPTELCDLCDERVRMGKRPTCVHHCQAAVLSFGSVEELMDEIRRKPNQAIFFPE
jgi:Fe-S-cluster-containing dehydrogenase component